MARPRHVRPTPAELEILKILWERGPLTVREILAFLPGERAAGEERATEFDAEEADPPRAYTSVMSLMNVMAEKGHLTRTLEGRAYRYAPADEPSQVRSDFLRDVWKRVFGGSTESMALHLLDVSAPTEEELDAIRSAIDAYRAGRNADDAKESDSRPSGRSRPRS
ncbi:MAG TPA: BlaI/MecI/CopY family transcriptional regulator [Pirellulaceae bacterium]|jgi:predicted transcriptional regulator|nr:BlaI/MecI/CopY family transcriptional regulator [Pirellulaceae bacterium]